MTKSTTKPKTRRARIVSNRGKMSRWYDSEEEANQALEQLQDDFPDVTDVWHFVELENEED